METSPLFILPSFSTHYLWAYGWMDGRSDNSCWDIRIGGILGLATYWYHFTSLVLGRKVEVGIVGCIFTNIVFVCGVHLICMQWHRAHCTAVCLGSRAAKSATGSERLPH